MKRRLFVLPLILLLLVAMIPTSAFADGGSSVTEIIKDLPENDDVLYMGTNDGWPVEVQLKFEDQANIGTVTYQWYRAVGEFDSEAEVEANAVAYGEKKPASSLSETIFSTGDFYRPTTEAGIFTYYVVFTNEKDGETEFKSSQRTTYVAPQVLFVKDQNYTDETVYYYFEGSLASELRVTLVLPENETEAASANFGTIKYQWYKSTEAVSEFIYDDFPFFDEEITPAIEGAGGTITYNAAAGPNGVTLTYTPANDEIDHFNYFVFVWDEKNGVISYTPNALDAVIEVLPSPVTSVQRLSKAKAEVVLETPTLPEDLEAQENFKYLLLAEGASPGESPAYLTAAFEGGAATLNLENLSQGKYNLYLVFTDGGGHEWPGTFKIADYPSSGGHTSRNTSDTPGTSINAETTDGAVTATGTVKTTNTGVAVTITDESLAKMAAHSQQTGSGLQINTDKAVATFDADAVKHISGLTGSGNVVLEINQADKSVLPAEEQALVGDRPVYDFTMKVGNQQVSSFGGGSVTFRVPYTLGPDEVPEAIVVYYIDDSGTLVPVKGAYDSKTGTVAFTTSHFSYYALGYNFVGFSDVAKSDWYYKPITFIAARGITTGVGDNLFAPDGSITRGQFVTMLLRAYGVEPETGASDNFSDAGNTYYTNYLAAAKKAGIASGIGDNLFAPDRSISRQDMFTLLYRALDVLGELPEGTEAVKLADYADGNDVAGYAQNAFEALITSGIVTGNGGRLLPDGTATRAEMAKVLYSLLSE